MKKNLLLLIVSLHLLSISCKQNEKTDKESTTPFLSEIEFNKFENSSLPHLFSNGESLLLSFVTQTDTLTSLYFSKLIDDEWSTPEAIASGTDWFVNWADYPQIAKNGENYIAHFLKKSDTSTYAYDVFVTQKHEGSDWSAPFKIHSDTTKTEHGFVSYAPFGESQFMVNWLDGRNTSGGQHGHEGGAMTLRAAIVDNDGDLDGEFLLDESVCDCCQTSAAMTANGPVVVYRDRSKKEIRDISIVKYENEQWTLPKTIHNDNWEIAGCPVNGPRVDAVGNTVAVAWFTAVDGKSKVQLVFSKDGGTNFGQPVQADMGNPLGRVDVALIDEKNALVSWVEDIDGESYIKFRKITADGVTGEVITVMPTDDSRASGFPQMTIFKNKVYIAWTKTEDGKTQVKTSVISLEEI